MERRQISRKLATEDITVLAKKIESDIKKELKKPRVRLKRPEEYFKVKTSSRR